jgi:hypothetical protein
MSVDGSDEAGRVDAGNKPELTRHPLAPTFQTYPEGDMPSGGYETVVGFVGDSPRAGYIRVYAGLAFRSYCELRVSDVALATPLDPGDADGPTVVRVAVGAPVEYVRTERLEGEGSYVLGAVRESYRGPTGDTAEGELEYDAKVQPLDPVSVVYPPCPPPITPVLYCVSDVYPPC